jgi:hypothetical protein
MAEANPMLSLDALTFQNAQAALEQGCAAVGAGETVFDLGGVRAADSSALVADAGLAAPRAETGAHAQVHQRAGECGCAGASCTASTELIG